MYWILREFTYLVFLIISQVFCRVLPVQGSDQLKTLKGPFIIAANHEGRLDPVWISFVLRKYSRGRFKDIRYFVWHVYYHMPIIGWYIRGLRNFSLINKQGFGVLDPGIQYMHDHQGVVGIFPEGKIKKITEKDKRAKRGVAYLAWKSQAPILPVYLKYHRVIPWVPYWELRVVLGESMKVYDIIRGSDDFQSVADQVLDQIYQLRHRTS